MTLAAAELIRRLLLHVLPSGFHRIRYFGFLANRHRRAALARCRQLLAVSPPTSTVADDAAPHDDREPVHAAVSRSICPAWQRGRLIIVGYLGPDVTSVNTTLSDSMIRTRRSKISYLY
jgi:hypothetical protein